MFRRGASRPFPAPEHGAQEPLSRPRARVADLDAPAGSQAARPQLHARSLSPELCSQRLALGERCPQVLTRLHAPSGAAKELAECKLGASTFEGPTRVGMHAE